MLNNCVGIPILCKNDSLLASVACYLPIPLFQYVSSRSRHLLAGVYIEVTQEIPVSLPELRSNNIHGSAGNLLSWPVTCCKSEIVCFFFYKTKWFFKKACLPRCPVKPHGGISRWDGCDVCLWRQYQHHPPCEAQFITPWFANRESFHQEMYGTLTPFCFPRATWLIRSLYLLVLRPPADSSTL